MLIKLEFSQQILKNAQIPHFVKICPVATEFSPVNRQADREMDVWTDMTKLIVALYNSVNALLNQSVNAVQRNNRCLF
jgi:hypothetical protein